MTHVKLLGACGLLISLASALPMALTHTSDAYAETEATRTATIRIVGMATPSCPLLVKRAVRQIEGVLSVDVDGEAKTAKVRYREGVTSAETIVQVIEEQAGFEARIVSDR